MIRYDTYASDKWLVHVKSICDTGDPGSRKPAYATLSAMWKLRPSMNHLGMLYLDRSHGHGASEFWKWVTQVS
jgi:hypothetical protein